MFALKSKSSGRTAQSRRAVDMGTEGRVLPRFLRRPARFFQRLDEIETRLPRFAATIMSGSLLAASAAYGAYLGGHMPTVMQTVTARTGFAVSDIRVAGDHETSEIDVLDKLQLDGWTALVGFNVDAARTRLGELPWVQSAEVRKIYPDAIEVSITERKPFAVWQHGRELTVIQQDGNPIVSYAGGRAELPLIIGFGAAEKASAFVEKLNAYPELASRIRAYVRVGDRRWDLRLVNGVQVKLPEEDVDGAIRELLRLDAENGLLDRDIRSVDLRLSERLIVQLTPTAMERRTEELEALKKAAKKAGRSI